MYKIVPATLVTIALAVSTAPLSAQESLTLPTIDVIGNTPLPGSDIERDRVPSNVQSVPASEFSHTVAPSVTDAMIRALPGVSRGDQTGNPFQPDLNYRGFTASPVIGTPQGVAVYQNGTRINEVFGDTVNWDLIPENAINRMTLAPSNPVYGLNALGGAVAIEMKNGFNYQGAQGEVSGGSYGRIGAAAEAGGQKDNVAAFISADAVSDDGWRAYSSSSRLRRMYVDIGAKGDMTEGHVSFTAASNRLGSVAATPVEMLNQDWKSIYTWPQTTYNQLAFLQASLDHRVSDTLALQANAYFRNFRQSHVDGNTTDAQSCAAPGLLCFGDSTTPLLDSSGNQVADVYGANLGQIDRTWTTSNSFGGTLQATETSRIAEHGNHFVVGASLDHGRVKFQGNSELGTIDSNLFVNGTGVLIQAPSADLAPVDLRSTSTYLGIYATDTFDITSQLSLTAGGRFNFARIRLDDQTGGPLSSDSRFSHLNPVVGLTYKITPDVTVYGGYSQANRAPTPLELGCADPTRPCLIDGFLISDPPLKQVVATTYEAGLRGTFNLAGTWQWNLGAWRSTNKDDIINVASQVSGFGYFLNAATTRRQGIEAGLKYKTGRWEAYANYTYVDATFQTALTLASPNNPAADAGGNIFVSPGDRIPSIPAHRFKAGFDYKVTDPWTVGADLNVVGSQYLVGDQSNQNPQVPAYWVVNLHTAYQVTKTVEVFGLVQNLFNQHYYVSGAFFDTGGIAARTFSDPRTFVPGMPLAAYAGVRATF
ncbi:MAG: TonB-dependent receptor [Pseudolabrys sp.]